METLKRTRPIAFVAVAAAFATLVACASDPATPSAANVSSPTARPTAVPPPTGDPVLRISGAISNRNEGEELVFDLKALEVLPSTTLNVYEPFLKKRVTFTGFDMRHLLATAGVVSEARAAHFTALDDYQVDLDIDLLQRGGILMATKDSGAPIPVDAGGPIRIIFPDGHATGENDDLWIWSVRAIEIR